MNLQRMMTKTALTSYAQLPETALPGWAWEVVARYDQTFSIDMKMDLVIEGAVIVTK